MVNRLLFCVIVVLCIALRLPACADEKQDKLRELVRLPGMTSTFTFGYNCLNGYSLSTEEDTPKDTVASLRKTLHNDATDAIIYYKIGDLYTATNKPIQALGAYGKSAALYQEQIKAAPSDGIKLARLALALHQAMQKKERDKVMASAVTLAPAEAQVWDIRAQIAFADANALLSGQEEKINEADTPFRMAKLLMLPYPKEKLDAVLRLLDQAKADYDKAVAVAPDDWHGYSTRWVMRLSYEIQTTLLHEALQGKTVSEEKQKSLETDYASQLMKVEGMSDLMAAAHVSHEQPLALGMAANFLMLCEAQRKPNTLDFTKGGFLKQMSEADQKVERDLMARMELMTHSANHSLAGQSALALGINQMIALSPEQSRISMLLAHTLLPDDPNIIECLARSYAPEKKYADIARLMKEALRPHESIRWRLLLAKMEEKQNHWDEVEQEINTALKSQPENASVNLALCAVMMHKAKDEGGLNACGEQIKHARELMGTTFTDDQSFSFNYMGGILFALIGDMDQARKYLHEAEGTEEQNADVKAVLALLP